MSAHARLPLRDRESPLRPDRRRATLTRHARQRTTPPPRAVDRRSNALRCKVAAMSLPATGRSLVLHWDSLGKDGSVSPKTAGAYATACARVLEYYAESPEGRGTPWEDIDVSRLDAAAAAGNFLRRSQGKLASSTADTYARTFTRAVPAFLEYIESPETWRPQMRRRRSSLRSSTLSSMSPPSSERTLASVESDQEEREVAVLLPSGGRAILRVPGRFSAEDADLLLGVLPAYIKPLLRG